MKMRVWCVAYAAIAALSLCGTTSLVAQNTAPDARAGVDAFNAALRKATLAMDNAALLTLWEEDGTALLPATPPIVGRPALAKFYADVMASLPDAKMKSFDLECSGIEIAGDFASEWCTEHQVVDLGAGKAPFDGKGTLLYVLHRGRDGVWRIRREMWNPA